MARTTKIVIGLLMGVFSVSGLSLNVYGSKLKYTFKNVELKEYEEMERLVLKELRKKNRSVDDIAAYRAQNALRILFAKRDNNGKRMALFDDIQSRTNEASFLLAMQSLVEESMLMLSVRNLPPEQKTTYLVILENLISEAEGYSGRFKSILENIAKANIKLDKKVKTYTHLAMNKAISPSKLASRVLERLKKEDEKSRKDIVKSDTSNESFLSADTSTEVSPVL